MKNLGGHITVPSLPLTKKVALKVPPAAPVARGGTVVALGITTGPDVKMALLPIFVNELTITGAVMGTQEDFIQLTRFVQIAGITPEIGKLLPMQKAEEGFREMWEGTIRGKTAFTR